MLMLNFPFIYQFLEVELRGCDHDLRTMIEHFPLTVRYFIYSIPKAKCRSGHLNVNIYIMAISHSLHLHPRLKLGTFSIDKGDGSENVTFKMNWRFFQLCRVYFNSLKIANVGQFPWS